MAAYVDDAGIMWKGKPRFHLIADTVAELHAFTASIGIKRCWYHSGTRFPHYDITTEQRRAAIEAGATAVSDRELVVIAKKIRDEKSHASDLPLLRRPTA